MILIISSKTDDHTVPVFEQLKAKNADVQLFDFSEFPTRLSIVVSYKDGDREYRLLNGDEEIDLGTCNVIWWRRPQRFEIDDRVVDPTAYEFAYSESLEAINGLLLALDAEWVNQPSHDEEASRKINHLRVAQEIGFKIPETLVTNSATEARAFVDTHGVRSTVYKAFRALPEAWRETRVLHPGELQMLSEVNLAPVIFQEYIPGNVDLRITVVGDQIFAAAIHSQTTDYPIDYRADLASAKMERHELPEDITKKIHEFMNCLRLSFGAIDMRLTPDDQYVFLEINPAGLYDFVEGPTGLPITEAIADLLIAYDEETDSDENERDNEREESANEAEDDVNGAGGQQDESE